VQPFKRGPDFIDPSWLSAAAGRPCRNLDVYLMGEEQVRSRFAEGCQGVDLALVEGAMGLFDGLNEEGLGSTAHVARLLRSPVLLVVDASRITRSVAALVQGYASFDPYLRVAGVVLNKVAGARHEAKLRGALRRHTDVPVLGAIPRHGGLTIPQRHLGLVPRPEHGDQESVLDAFYQAVVDHVDVDALLNIARSAPPLSRASASSPAPCGCVVPVTERPTIGVAFDAAFSFYYPSNLEALVAAGASLVGINTLQDHNLPPVDALYLGGGFPEMFMSELEANEPLRDAIRVRAQAGLPIYAECGGLMYLAESIRWGTRIAEMTGVLPVQVEVTDRPQGHGYVRLRALSDNPWFRNGEVVRGHEFHHSRLASACRAQFGYQVERGTGIDGAYDGIVQGRVLASYAHLHVASVPAWANRFVDLALAHRLERRRAGESLSAWPATAARSVVSPCVDVTAACLGEAA
jgi:cobyrinic acid a,c-diamide synthase